MKRLLTALLFVICVIGLAGVSEASTVSIGWNASVADATHDAATGYNIYKGSGTTICTASGPLAGPAHASVGAVVTYTDSSAGANGSTVCYEVSATNPGGESAHSNRVSTVIPSNPPNAPTGLAITGSTP
jgi:hypothetical protein